MTRPDFSGTWRLNHAASRLQIPAPDDTVFVVGHRDPALRISRTHTAGALRDTFSIDLTTDGRPVHVNHEGRELRGKAYWDGETLVFDTEIVWSGEHATNVVRYSLAQDGRRIVAGERFRSALRNYDNTWAMDRATPDTGTPDVP